MTPRRASVLLVVALAVVLATEVAHAQARKVIVNGVRLTDGQVGALQRQYGVRMHDGDYWYDGRTGAWGLRGGPTVGFVVPGLAMGGALRRDASGGTTGVIINGRELHWLDVTRLQQILPVYRGSYWMDASGNFGAVGGLLLGNIWALSQRSGGRREGILSTYDKTGMAVIGGR
jgi:hypothetical protein